MNSFELILGKYQGVWILNPMTRLCSFLCACVCVCVWILWEIAKLPFTVPAPFAFPQQWLCCSYSSIFSPEFGVVNILDFVHAYGGISYLICISLLTNGKHLFICLFPSAYLLCWGYSGSNFQSGCLFPCCGALIFLCIFIDNSPVSDSSFANIFS